VRISSSALDTLTFETIGEFLTISITHVQPGSDPLTKLDRDTPLSASVIVKYIRSVLPLLQRADQVRIGIVNQQYILIEYTMDTVGAFVLLKDQFIM
jgi:hypothetical protein